MMLIQYFYQNRHYYVQLPRNSPGILFDIIEMKETDLPTHGTLFAL